MNIEKVTILTLIAIFSVTLILYNWYNQAPPQTAENSPDFLVSTIALTREFATDERTANAKYVEKTIDVSGIVQKVLVDDGKVSFIMSGSASTNVVCIFANPPSHPRIIENVSFVTVRGICAGRIDDVLLTQCNLMNVIK